MTNTEKSILLFPQARRIGKIKRVAEVLSSKETVNAQNSYWKRIMNELDHKLSNLGLSREEVFREANSFSKEVQRELDKLQSTNNRNTTGDAS